MDDVGRLVENRADAVAAEVAHHRVAVSLGKGLDRMPDVARGGARAYRFDAEHHRVIGDLAQARCLAANVADEIHAARVAMPSVDDHGDVNVEDVAVLDRLVAGNPVTHDMIHRRANRLREPAVVQRSGDRPVRRDELEAQAVEVVGGDPRLHERCDVVERLGDQAAGLPHAGEPFRPMHLDGGGEARRLERRRFAAGCRQAIHWVSRQA